MSGSVAYPSLPAPLTSSSSPPKTCLEEPQSTARLFIQCADLAKADLLSLSDPYVIVQYRTHPSYIWQEVGKTEVVPNNHHPQFSTPIHIPYYFERHQYLRLVVYDYDKETHKPHDALGEAEFTLAQIITAPGSTLTHPLSLTSNASSKPGRITVSAQEMTSGRRFWSVMAAYRLPMSVWLCCLPRVPCVAFRLYESVGGIKKLIYASEAAESTINPVWEPADIIISFEAEPLLVVQVVDQKRYGGEKLLGECTLPVEAIQKGQRCEVGLDSTEGGGAGPETPLLQQSLFVLEKSSLVHTFFEFFSGGGNINLAVGIDFTISNGNPADPSSLHYRGGETFYPQLAYLGEGGERLYHNPYQRAINEVVSILDFYDSDHRYPVYGFGAKVRTGSFENKLSHCFALSALLNDTTDPYVQGVAELFRVYAYAVKSVVLWGPTFFAPLIHTVSTLAKQNLVGPAHQHDYTILLIITDGHINDMESTKKAIVEASSLPFSILILGVGDEDFSSMVELDGNLEPVAYLEQGVRHVALRDMVHFVNMNMVPPNDQEGLVKALLKEIPEHYVSYQKVAIECRR